MGKKTRNERRKAKKEKEREEASRPRHNGSEEAKSAPPAADGDEELKVELSYVAPDLSSELASDTSLAVFGEIFAKFAKPEELTSSADAGAPEDNEEEDGEPEGKAQDHEKEEEEARAKLTCKSRRQQRLESRLTVAQLKQLVERPDVVEAHDVTAADPRFLVHLKAYRSSVPVPRHWSHKRKYLQGKRGIEKPPFALPDFIADTGIAKIRETILEEDAAKKVKQKARERVQPKMGKIDIDYEVLHDAFFKYQTRPKLSRVGDLYYEGREFEVDMKEKRPGHLSAELKEALGMVEGMPPPWLVNMQRYGPPPSYPNLKIPGLNAPLPEGAQFGFHAGGWGKPPVDEYGRPLYGDVFGTATTEEEVVVDRSHWGEVMEESDDGGDEDEDEDEDAAAAGGEEDASGTATPATVAEDGMESHFSGLTTPDQVDLRKRQGGLETPETPVAPQELYKVLEQREASVAGGVFGSDKTYVIPGRGDVAVALDADQIEEQLKDSDALLDKYEQQVEAQGGEGGLSEQQRKRKRKAEAAAGGGGSKKAPYKF